MNRVYPDENSHVCLIMFIGSKIASHINKKQQAILSVKQFIFRMSFLAVTSFLLEISLESLEKRKTMQNASEMLKQFLRQTFLFCLERRKSYKGLTF